MTILVSRSMFFKSRNPIVPLFIYEIDLSKVMIFTNHILGHISVTNGQNLPKFSTE